MKFSGFIKKFWTIFATPRVAVFIVVGTMIIFLTFLTTNNAMEIAISGIASVFIGIGVNNFSAFETRVLDQEKYRKRLSHTLEIMELAKAKINRLNRQLGDEPGNLLKAELSELEQFISISMNLMNEEGKQ